MTTQWIIFGVAFGLFAVLGQIAIAHIVYRHQEVFGYDASGDYGLPE